MSSPFERLLNKALQLSTRSDNKVLREAQKIIARGYPEHEIISILERFKSGLIDQNEVTIITEALSEIVEDEEDEEDEE